MISLRRHDWVIHFITIALCSYFLVKAITVFLSTFLEGSSENTAALVLPKSEAPVAGGSEQASDYKVVLERNIFNSAESGSAGESAPEEMSPELLGELGPAVKSSLPVKLMGTLMVGDGTDRRSSAMVSGGKGGKSGSEVYYPGDEKSFAPNVRLTKVDKNRIEFINGSRLEYIEIEDFAAKKTAFASPEEVHGKGPEKKDDKTPTAPSEGTKVVVEQREIDEALQNLDKLYSEIRIVPNIKDGQPAGMKVLSIKPGSILNKLGVKRGDVLEKVNGQELDIKRGMELFSQMKDMKNFSLDVVRGGKNQTIEYEIR